MLYVKNIREIVLTVSDLKKPLGDMAWQKVLMFEQVAFPFFLLILLRHEKEHVEKLPFPSSSEQLSKLKSYSQSKKIKKFTCL